MKKLSIIAAICCCLAITGIFASHTHKKTEIFIDGTIPARTESDLILNSDLIIEGTVAKILPSKWSNENFWRGEDVRNVLQTDILINVNNILSGDCGDTVAVRIDKGEDAHTIVHSEGYPDFVENENVLLFLARDDSDIATDEDYYVLTGMKYGKYELSRDTNSRKSIGKNQYKNTADGGLKTELDVSDLQAKITAEKNAHPNYQNEKEARQAEVLENNKQYFTDLQ